MAQADLDDKVETFASAIFLIFPETSVLDWQLQSYSSLCFLSDLRDRCPLCSGKKLKNSGTRSPGLSWKSVIPKGWGRSPRRYCLNDRSGHLTPSEVWTANWVLLGLIIHDWFHESELPKYSGEVPWDGQTFRRETPFGHIDWASP